MPSPFGPAACSSLSPIAWPSFMPPRCASFRQPMSPVVGVAAVVLDDQDVELLVTDTIIDAKGESLHCMAAKIAFHHRPAVGTGLNLHDRGIELPQEALAEAFAAPLVKRHSLDQFRLGLGMIVQP